MLHGAMTKTDIAIYPVSATNGATVTGQVDTLGFRYATFYWLIATGAATDDNPSVCKISEADDTTTSITDITAFVGDGTGGFTVPNADTSNPQTYIMNMDLRGRKRYLTCTISPTTTQINGCLCVLTRGAEAPNTTTEAGCAVLVNG